MQRVQRTAVAAVAAALLLGAGAVSAQDLTYEPVNPSFGGDPLNSRHLQSLADKQKQPEHQQSSSFDPPSAQEQFADSLERRILSRTSQTITDRIFGEEAEDQGNFTVGSQEIEFQRRGDQIDITLRDINTGATTDLTIPTPAP